MLVRTVPRGSVLVMWCGLSRVDLIKDCLMALVCSWVSEVVVVVGG